MSQPQGVGGVRVSNTAQALQDRLPASAAVIAKLAQSPGVRSVNVLRVAANVADGETVTIGGNVFEVDIINTDAGVDTVGAMDATTDPILVTFDGAHGFVPGQLVRIENEITKVLGVPTTTKAWLGRARSGTTAATHADNSDVFESNAHPAANIPVGLVTTLTPAVFTDALVDEINNALHGTERATVQASTIFGSVVASGPSDNEVLIREFSATPAELALACTETLAGANNVWAAAAMYGGVASGQRGIAVSQRVPNATEVALGNLTFEFPFTVRYAFVEVRVTSTPGVAKAWDGAITKTAGQVELDNGGSTDWAATDTVTVIALTMATGATTATVGMASLRRGAAIFSTMAIAAGFTIIAAPACTSAVGGSAWAFTSRDRCCYIPRGAGPVVVRTRSV